MRHETASGFTLLEVMIALIIFALCATTLIQQSGRNLQHASRLETRMLANWIAENELEQLKLARQLPTPGSQSRELIYGKQQWTVTREISTTTNKDLWRAVVQVKLKNGSDNDYQLTGYLGRF